MHIKVVIYLDDTERVSFEGPAETCPPIPAVGSSIVIEEFTAIVEGIRHTYHHAMEQVLIEVFA